MERCSSGRSEFYFNWKVAGRTCDVTSGMSSNEASAGCRGVSSSSDSISSNLKTFPSLGSRFICIFSGEEAGESAGALRQPSSLKRSCVDAAVGVTLT